MVLVLIIVGALVVVIVSSWRPETRAGAPLLLIEAEASVTATPPTITVPVDYGTPCAPLGWNDRSSFLAVQAGVDLSGKAVAFLTEYTSLTANLVNDGGSRTVSLHGNVSWEVTSPVDGRVLTLISPDGDTVLANGTSYGPGGSWTEVYTYDVDVGGDTVRIVERITFHNRGIVETRIVPEGTCP